jgi:hypothetical protein
MNAVNRLGLLGAMVLMAAAANSGETGDNRRQVEVHAQIHPELPPYRFFLTPDTVHVSSDHRDTRQTLKPEGQLPADPAFLFLLHDINFDGYLDFATTEHGGAKWGFYHHQVFDPTSGQFDTNWLTTELERLPANRMYPDGKSKQIRVEHLVVGEGRASESYEIRDDQLVLVESKEKVYDEDREESYVVTKRLIDGEMKVVQTEP